MRKLMIAPSVGCCDLFHVEEQVQLINEKIRLPPHGH